MSRLIKVTGTDIQLPEGDFYTTKEGNPMYSRIRAERLQALFDAARVGDTPIAPLLLENPGYCIYHLDSNNTGFSEGENVLPVLLGVNYTRVHSEGKYIIAVQNVTRRRGPWILYRPPESQEKDFYLQDIPSPRRREPEFQEEPTNPMKIEHRFIHMGNPQAIFDSFRELGFKFVDEPMSEDYERKIDYLGAF